MSKGWRNNLILALVMVAAAGGLWVMDAREEASNAADKKSRAVSGMRSDAVVTAEFQDDSGQSLSLTKKEGQWGITAPVALRTNATSVKNLLDVLEKTYEQKVTDTMTDGTPYGLATPTARLTVKDQANNTLRILAGATAPASKKRYVALGEKGPVVLMAESDVTGLMQKNDALRDKRLASLETHDLTRLVIKSKDGGEILLSQDKENNWNLEKPLQDRADANRVRAYLFALTGANGTGFKTQRPEGDGDWTLELTPTKGNAELVTIWRVDQELLATRTGESDLLVVPNYLTEELNKSGMDLVALRPLDLKTDLNTLQLEQEGKTLTADKKDKKWPRSEWNDIEEILTRDALRGADLKSKTDLPTWMKITVGKGDKTHTFTLHKEKETIFIAPPGRPVALELTPLQAESLQKAVTKLVTPTATGS
ncbi:MAG: DUF4340 domain-containing protein [Magnetococcus sp. YQC-5]